MRRLQLRRAAGLAVGLALLTTTACSSDDDAPEDDGRAAPTATLTSAAPEGDATAPAGSGSPAADADAGAAAPSPTSTGATGGDVPPGAAAPDAAGPPVLPPDPDPTGELARTFTQALIEGARADGARVATPEVVALFEPWTPRPDAAYAVTGPGAFTLRLDGGTATCDAGSRLVVSCTRG